MAFDQRWSPEKFFRWLTEVTEKRFSPSFEIRYNNKMRIFHYYSRGKRHFATLGSLRHVTSPQGSLVFSSQKCVNLSLRLINAIIGGLDHQDSNAQERKILEPLTKWRVKATLVWRSDAYSDPSMCDPFNRKHLSRSWREWKTLERLTFF